MEEKLAQLRNTMMLIETKGESTKIMADCVRFIENMIEDEHKKATENKAEE